jgi:tight adherence protein C
VTSLSIVGALLGLGVILIWSGLSDLRRRSERLQIELSIPATAGEANHGLPGVRGRPRQPTSDSLFARLGTILSRRLPLRPSEMARSQDLAAAGSNEPVHAATVAAGALCGVVLGPVVSLGLTVDSLSLPIVASVLLSCAGLLAGAIYPERRLAARAAEERRHFRRALSCWLQLVSLAQAGGMGLEEALQAASRQSEDRFFLRLRSTLDYAGHAGISAWDALGQLGSDLGLIELEELAATIALAGAEGARIRATLSAKAGALRTRMLAEAQSVANATTERLFLPSVFLLAGFLLFIGYPATVTLAHAF